VPDQAIRVLRVLCREEFGIASAKSFVEDVQRAMEWLSGHYIYTPEQARPACSFLSLCAQSAACSHLHARAGAAFFPLFCLPLRIALPHAPTYHCMPDTAGLQRKRQLMWFTEHGLAGSSAALLLLLLHALS
jgi:hypothetical protein